MGSGVSEREAARRWGCSRHTAKKRLAAGEIPPELEQPEDAGPQFPDLRTFPEDADSTWRTLIEWQDQSLQWERQQAEATVVLPDKAPVAITVRGDWHLGNQYTDYRSFLRHTELIQQTPGLYCVELGDLIDGYIQPSKLQGQHEALARVKVQRHLVWDAMKKLNGKVLALASGQHDHWSVFQADFEPVEWCAADNHVPYLGHGGLLRIQLGDQTYTFHVRHKYRYNSSYNATHSIKQFWRFDGDSDVGVHADKHTPAAEYVIWKGELRIAARPGTYKPHDDWEDSFGYPEGKPIMPTILLWPDHREMQVLWTVERAADMLPGLRQ
jgi:hypothetical protein